jgi:hypothetical protein
MPDNAPSSLEMQEAAPLELYVQRALADIKAKIFDQSTDVPPPTSTEDASTES